MPGNPILRDIVLLGGGHAHAVVVRQWAMKPLPGVRMTLISRDVLTPYSGMLPGLLATHYSFEDAHIDLARLCLWANVRFVEAEILGLDAKARKISLKNRPPVFYDVVSLDTGSTPDLISVPGAAEHSVAVKPVHEFYQRWQQLTQRIESEQRAMDIAVVGAGAGGFELLLAMHYRLSLQAHSIKHRFHWIIRGENVLTAHNSKAQNLALQECTAKGIHVHHNFSVKEVQKNRLLSDDGRQQSCDEIIWCTDARGPDWLADCGLQLDDKGFLAVNDYLQSESFDNIFAAGDIATQTRNPRPKAGVFAVRAGPCLSDNLQRHLLKKPLKAFNPQAKFLSILALGDKRAIASRGGFAAKGSWVWHWKNHIDISFMDKFNKLAAKKPMRDLTPPRILLDDEAEDFSPDAPRCSGCGAKIAGDILSRVVKTLEPVARDDQLSGLESADDAAIIKPDCRLIAQSVDQIRSMIDEPYLFARIASNHALSDLYAMGAEPQSAMAIVNLPVAAERIQERELQQIMQGISDQLGEAGCALSGGHTAESAELSIGLVVNGLLDEGHVIHKQGLQPGQSLILSKPLGTGVILAANMQGICEGRVLRASLKNMLLSNQPAADIFMRCAATAMTDVTGFGLSGHLLEMLRPAGLGCHLQLQSIPLIEGALTLSEKGVQSSLYAKNRRYADAFDQATIADDPRYKLLFDPQTSGGLLAGIDTQRAESCLAELHKAGFAQAAIIGSVQGDTKIIID